MPWSEVTEMNSKIKFISDYLDKKYSFTNLCNVHGISRKTGYKIVKRYEEEGSVGLISKPKAHYNHPLTTDNKIKDFIIEVKKRYPHWGPKKIKHWLINEYSEITWPAASTIGTILKSHGLVNPFKRRTRISVYNNKLADINAPNDVWSADFKGQFKLGNKQYCYPLTITDNYSRYFLQCKIVPGTRFLETQAGFIEAFQKYGLPKVIRTDNGIPFAAAGACGLSRLSLWFVKLDILPERIPLGNPQCNGRHERLHKTLKAETTKPAGHDFIEQQHKFDEFVTLYNNVRPHEALDGKRPREIYIPSTREYPSNITPPQYQSDMKVCRIRSDGYINFAKSKFYLGEIFYGEDIALRECGEHTWSLYFYNLNLGTLNTKEQHIEVY